MPSRLSNRWLFGRSPTCLMTHALILVFQSGVLHCSISSPPRGSLDERLVNLQTPFQGVFHASSTQIPRKANHACGRAALEAVLCDFPTRDANSGAAVTPSSKRGLAQTRAPPRGATWRRELTSQVEQINGVWRTHAQRASASLFSGPFRLMNMYFGALSLATVPLAQAERLIALLAACSLIFCV